MRNLFNFILKQYFFFLFVLLQVVAFMLIVQNNTYHRSFFINSTNVLAGNIYSLQSNVREYFKLQGINRQLVIENETLRNQQASSFLKTDQNIFTFHDTLHQRQFTYINARVINNSVRDRNNYITLNKGRMQGVKPDMGVITHNGVVGIVKDVSNNFSSVLSTLHSDIQISAKLTKNNQLGTVLWEGYDYRTATMLYIPPHLELEVGDSIVTSGFSHIFPENVFIGTISDYEIRRGDNFYTIEIDLASDFNSLENVYVVKNIFREELDMLESESRSLIR